ncbi:MAG: hypothetical protein AAF494_00270 [Pseudomonadota bacterium]
MSTLPVKTAPQPVFSPAAREDFLESLALYGNVRLACRAASVSPQTVYRTRQCDAALAEAWDRALIKARTHVEAVLAERAVNGVEEAVYYHGEEIARRTRFDSRLLLAHLARLDRLAERVGESGAPGSEPVEAEAEAGFERSPSEPLALEVRLAAMEAARPECAGSLSSCNDPGTAEAVQLLAFEHGVKRWWELENVADLPEAVIEKIDQMGAD